MGQIRYTEFRILPIALDRGINNHVFSLSGRGTSPSLRLPLDWIGGEQIRFRNQWAYASLALGLGLLILVNLELILRQILTLFGQAERLNSLTGPDMASAD